jgi:hypothetical protein
VEAMRIEEVETIEAIRTIKKIIPGEVTKIKEINKQNAEVF